MYEMKERSDGVRYKIEYNTRLMYVEKAVTLHTSLQERIGGAVTSVFAVGEFDDLFSYIRFHFKFTINWTYRHCLSSEN